MLLRLKANTKPAKSTSSNYTIILRRHPESGRFFSNIGEGTNISGQLPDNFSLDLKNCNELSELLLLYRAVQCKVIIVLYLVRHCNKVTFIVYYITVCWTIMSLKNCCI